MEDESEDVRKTFPAYALGLHSPLASNETEMKSKPVVIPRDKSLWNHFQSPDITDLPVVSSFHGWSPSRLESSSWNTQPWWKGERRHLTAGAWKRLTGSCSRLLIAPEITSDTPLNGAHCQRNLLQHSMADHRLKLTTKGDRRDKEDVHGIAKH